MPHRRDPMNATSAGANGARHQGRGKGTEPKDSTGSTARNRAAAVSTPPERKSTRDERRAALLEGMGVPAPWRSLGEVLAEAVDPVLRAILEAGRNVDAEPGDGAAAIMPNGEVLLLHVSPDGLVVRRGATPDEVALFLAGAREAA